MRVGKRQIAFFLSLLLLVFMSSCKNKTEKQQQLSGFWVLKSMNGQESGDIFHGAFPILDFDAENNILTGTGGCNAYKSVFNISGNILRLSQFESSSIECDEKNEEALFLEELCKEHEFSVKDSLLTFSKEGKVVLQFVKGESHDQTEIHDNADEHKFTEN